VEIGGAKNRQDRRVPVDGELSDTLAVLLEGSSVRCLQSSEFRRKREPIDAAQHEPICQTADWSNHWVKVHLIHSIQLLDRRLRVLFARKVCTPIKLDIDEEPDNQQHPSDGAE